MPSKPVTVDEYLDALPADKRAALEKIRRAIRAAAPRADEVISYGVPIYKLNGKMLGGFGAATKHCALYGFTAAPRSLVRDYGTSRGTVRFPADKPLPASLVKELVKHQVAAIEAREAAKQKRGEKAASKKKRGYGAARSHQIQKKSHGKKRSNPPENRP